MGPCFSSSSELFHGTYDSIGTLHSFNRVSLGSGKKEFMILGSSKKRHGMWQTSGKKRNTYIILAGKPHGNKSHSVKIIKIKTKFFSFTRHLGRGEGSRNRGASRR